MLEEKRENLEKSPFVIFLLIISLNLFALPLKIYSAKALNPVIYVMPNGTVNGTTSIQTTDNVTYIFTSDINDQAIVIQRDNIVIDGRGRALQGSYVDYSYGVDLSNMTNVTVENTKIDAFWYGIILRSSSKNRISGNNITNSFDAVWLESSLNDSVSGNNITNNNGWGVVFFGSSNETLHRNNITNNYHGVVLSPSSKNVISENDITNNTLDGIALYGYFNYTTFEYSTSENNITNNKITNNKADGIKLISSSNNTISGNVITNNSYGTELDYSSNNTISRNDIIDNNHGIEVRYSSNNMMYHNNFVSNAQQVYGDGILNAWDNGYPSGGNYWSDSNKTDAYRNSYQNSAGSDGICDNPYIIDPSNSDLYPLMNPYPTHDLAVTNFGVTKTISGKGTQSSVFSVITNLGNFNESVSYSIYYNDTLFENSTLSDLLQLRAFGIVLYLLNTVGLAYGNYSVRIRVSPVVGETSIANNEKSCWFMITISGDSNGDHTVNATDLVFIANHLGQSPYSSQWNENCDLNNDGRINVLDLIVCATHLGQKW
jgi:parallel beta-helix repeat protein